MKKILIIEDDLRLGSFTKMTLEATGYLTELVLTASAASQYLQANSVDLVLLDLDLPDLSGIELCKSLRELYTFPIVFFSAEGGLQKKLDALEAGANDYIVKPIDIRELLARVKAQLQAVNRSAQGPTPPKGRISYTIDSDQFYTEAGLLPLSDTAKKILYLLFQHEKVFSKAEIYQQVWHQDYLETRDGHLIESQISRLRKQLKAYPTACQIKTRYGQGYYLSVTSEQ